MDTTKVHSDVPAEPLDLAAGKPFEYSVDGVEFEIEPLTLFSYMETEKSIFNSLRRLMYYSVDIDEELKKELDPNVQGLDAILKAENLSSILFKLSIPKDSSEKHIKKLINDHNKKYWFNSSKRIKIEVDDEGNESLSDAFEQWFVHHISINDVLPTASYLMRYCSEYKKKIFLTLQKGIGYISSMQNQMNQDLNECTDVEFQRGYESFGSELMGMHGA